MCTSRLHHSKREGSTGWLALRSTSKRLLCLLCYRCAAVRRVLFSLLLLYLMSSELSGYVCTFFVHMKRSPAHLEFWSCSPHTYNYLRSRPSTSNTYSSLNLFTSFFTFHPDCYFSSALLSTGLYRCPQSASHWGVVFPSSRDFATR